MGSIPICNIGKNILAVPFVTQNMCTQEQVRNWEKAASKKTFGPFSAKIQFQRKYGPTKIRREQRAQLSKYSRASILGKTQLGFSNRWNFRNSLERPKKNFHGFDELISNGDAKSWKLH